jgi:predicted amidohydrolase
MPKNRTIMVAACAPASYGFVKPQFNDVTTRIIDGRETHPARIGEHVQRLLDHQIRILERAGKGGAEVAVIPEDCMRLAGLVARQHTKRFCAEVVRESCKEYRRRIGEVCQRFSMHVVGGVMMHRGGRFYNTALMLGPDGKIEASYDKTHLVTDEAGSVTHGKSLPVFDTPIGRVGLLVCWDIVFPEPYAVLALSGAEVIFQPTFGHADESHDVTARSRAMDWSVPLVVSMWGGSACIIDHAGNVTARTGRVGDTIATAPLTLGSPRKWLFMNDVSRQKPSMRRPHLYSKITERKK